MKKIISILLSVLLASTLANAQMGWIAKGFKGGLSLATVAGGDAPSGVSTVTRYAVGGFAELMVAPEFSIEPGIYYDVKGFSVNQSGTFFGASFDLRETVSLAYLEFPLLAKYYIGPRESQLSICAGPSFGLLLRAKGTSDLNGSVTEQDIKDKTASTDFGLVVGVGTEMLVGSLDASFDIRYNLGLSTNDKNGGTSVKNRVLTFLIGVAL